MILSENIKNEILLNYYKIQSISKFILIIMIVLLSFSLPFGWLAGRDIINNMFYVWLITLNFKYIYFYLKNNKVVLLLFLLFLSITFSSFIVPSDNYENYRMFIKYFFLPILIIITSIKRHHIKYLINGFLIGMFINEFISYGMYFGYIKDSFFGYTFTGSESNPVPFLSTHIQYTIYLSFAIVLSFFTFFNSKNIFIKIVIAIFTITMVINIFLTIGRTGQFTFLMTSIFLAIMYFKNNWKYILYSLVGLGIVFILAFNFSSNTNARMKHGYSDIEKVIKEKDFNTSWGIRLSSYIIIPDIIKDERFNIFYGMGYCKVNDNIMDIQLNKFGKDSGFKDTFGYLHNTYISMLAGTGFVGFVIFIIFWFYLFFVRIEDYYLSFIRYANMFVITFQGISNELFWQHEIMLLSAVFISITTYVTTKNNKEELNA